jgi:hypothetical protein
LRLKVRSPMRVYSGFGDRREETSFEKVDTH